MPFSVGGTFHVLPTRCWLTWWKFKPSSNRHQTLNHRTFRKSGRWFRESNQPRVTIIITRWISKLHLPALKISLPVANSPAWPLHNSRRVDTDSWLVRLKVQKGESICYLKCMLILWNFNLPSIKNGESVYKSHGESQQSHLSSFVASSHPNSWLEFLC